MQAKQPKSLIQPKHILNLDGFHPNRTFPNRTNTELLPWASKIKHGGRPIVSTDWEERVDKASPRHGSKALQALFLVLLMPLAADAHGPKRHAVNQKKLSICQSLASGPGEFPRVESN